MTRGGTNTEQQEVVNRVRRGIGRGLTRHAEFKKFGMEVECPSPFAPLPVDRLTESPRVALARIWPVQPSEGCTGCPLPAGAQA